MTRRVREEINGHPYRTCCWLKQFATPERGWHKERSCYGRMDRAHLLPKQLLKREGQSALLDDPRVWVPACRYHHDCLDNFLGLVVPRESIPEALEDLAEEIGLAWYLDRRYGALEAA